MAAMIVVVPSDDRMLDVAAMQASAERGGERLQVVHAPGSSHFVLFDAPAPPLVARPDPSLPAPARVRYHHQ